MVKQRNGHITASSEVGKGTIFRVYIPAIEGEEETDVESTVITPASGTETVQLVDDEEFPYFMKCLDRADTFANMIKTATALFHN